MERVIWTWDENGRCWFDYERGVGGGDGGARFLLDDAAEG